MPRGYIETDPSTSSNFVTLSPEYPKAPFLIWILAQWYCGKVINWPFRFQKQAGIQLSRKDSYADALVNSLSIGQSDKQCGPRSVCSYLELHYLLKGF